VTTEVDPLSPDNHIIFGTGPLTGTLAPGSSPYYSHCPLTLTSLFGRSNFGGNWGPELKYAGFDHLEVIGSAPEPVYLWITDDGVKIMRAAHLWERMLFSIKQAIRNELKDPQVRVLAIGAAVKT